MSPKARRLAREHGVDVTRLRGSGPGGEILAEDILKAAQGASATVSAAGKSQTSSAEIMRLGTVGRPRWPSATTKAGLPFRTFS